MLMTIFEALVLSRWVYFASVFVLFGSTLFWFTIGGESASADRGRLPRSYAATKRLLRVAAPLAAVSGLAWLTGILANMTDGFSNIVDPEILRVFFFETQFGPVAIFRLCLFAGLVAIVLLPWRDRLSLTALLVTSGLLLVSQAWLGHAAEGGANLRGALMILAYSVHMFAAAAWVGGLPALLFALVEQRHFDPDAAREWTVDLLLRFSAMAVIAVALIVISGIANAGFRVSGSFDKLFWTPYGEVLVTKIAAVTVMLALAYFNRFIALPKLSNASMTGKAQIIRLRVSVAFELFLAVLVLGIAAVLGITPPPQ
jgi:putative copper resistance protein D